MPSLLPFWKPRVEADLEALFGNMGGAAQRGRAPEDAPAAYCQAVGVNAGGWGKETKNW